MRRTAALPAACTVALATSAATSTARAQRGPGPRDGSLRGRASLTVSLGESGSEAATNGPTGQSARSGAVVQLAYERWVAAEWGASLSAGVRDHQADAGLRGQRAAAVLPLLAGITYYPRAAAIGTAVRPYAGVAAGAYVGLLSSNGASGQRALSQTVPGARAQLGVDWFTRAPLKLGAWGAYEAVPNFSQLGGYATRHSRFALGVSAGVLFGRVH